MKPYRQRIRPYRVRRTLQLLGLLRIPRGFEWRGTREYVKKFCFINHLTGD